jgi:hypothetical protein
MDRIDQTRQLISEINRLHRAFFSDCFETGLIEKVNLSRILQRVPAAHVYVENHEKFRRDFMFSVTGGGKIA